MKYSRRSTPSNCSHLAREFGRKRWGDEGYAMEELVAELGAPSSAPTST